MEKKIRKIFRLQVTESRHSPSILQKVGVVDDLETEKRESYRVV